MHYPGMEFYIDGHTDHTTHDGLSDGDFRGEIDDENYGGTI